MDQTPNHPLNPKGSRANKIFYTVFILLLIGSVVATFVRIVVLKDYQIVAETSCDPTTEKCFVYECDPVSDTSCSANPAERISYYKMISKKAATIAACEATADKVGCGEELSCIEGENNCAYTLCDPAKLADGEKCSE
ncbi:MAG: hypothetical protein WCO10_02465 [bacterium]